MTRRIVHLIEDRGVNPSSVLALTFSRAAAQELRERLEMLLGEEIGDRPGVFTLHGFALRQLLRLGGAPVLPHPIRIADDYDERIIVRELARLTGARVKDVRDEIQDLASDWESLAVEREEWEQGFPHPAFLAAWRQHRRVYGYTLRAELVYALKKALDEDPDLEVDPAFTRVLVDEYQDLNKCELAVIERLARTDRELFVAGDDDQSIYGFRNAFPLGLREFFVTYPGAAEEELAECHRCDRDILATGLRVAEQDVNRIPKALDALPTADGGRVEARSFPNIAAEARGIATICRALVDNDVSPGRILILLRNNPGGVYSTPIIDELGEVGLDAELPTNPFAILDADEGRAVICWLRLFRDAEDALAWRELLELRDNGVGEGALRAVYGLAVERGERFDRTLQAVADDPDLLSHQRRGRIAGDVREINERLEEGAELRDGPPSSGIEAVLDLSDLPAGDDRTAVAELLLGLVEDDEEATILDVEEALHGSRSGYDEDEREGALDRVQIMSMHTAKGLTADAVIVAACEDELIPGEPENERELDDQRRLLYVSLTRAKHYLFVTMARERHGVQSHRLQVPVRRRFTQFLRDYLTLNSH